MSKRRRRTPRRTRRRIVTVGVLGSLVGAVALVRARRLDASEARFRAVHDQL